MKIEKVFILLAVLSGFINSFIMLYCHFHESLFVSPDFVVFYKVINTVLGGIILIMFILSYGMMFSKQCFQKNDSLSSGPRKE